mgnify:CR=1 FL=1
MAARKQSSLFAASDDDVPLPERLRPQHFSQVVGQESLVGPEGALTRMVAGGDLIRSDDGYRLSERLLERQRRQDDALRPALRDWDGSWVTAVVTSVGEDARTRSDLRKLLQDSRFGELREGVWLRPDNLRAELDPGIARHVRLLRSIDGAPAELAAQLWDLAGWSAAATELIAAMSRARDLPTEFTIAAAMVRHLEAVQAKAAA